MTRGSTSTWPKAGTAGSFGSTSRRLWPPGMCSRRRASIACRPSRSWTASRYYEGHPLCFDPSTGLLNRAASPQRPLQRRVRRRYRHRLRAPLRLADVPAWPRGVNGPLSYWYDALDDEAATGAQHLRRLLESRPILTRVPDGGTGIGHGRNSLHQSRRRRLHHGLLHRRAGARHRPRASYRETTPGCGGSTPAPVRPPRPGHRPSAETYNARAAQRP